MILVYYLLLKFYYIIFMAYLCECINDFIVESCFMPNLIIIFFNN